MIRPDRIRRSRRRRLRLMRASTTTAASPTSGRRWPGCGRSRSAMAAPARSATASAARLAYLMATRSDADCNVGYYGVAIENYLGEADAIRTTAPSAHRRPRRAVHRGGARRQIVPHAVADPQVRDGGLSRGRPCLRAPARTELSGRRRRARRSAVACLPRPPSRA